MKTLMWAIGLALIFSASVIGAAPAPTEQAVEGASPAPVEEFDETNLPRKEREYQLWEKASAVARAWHQPLVVFIECSKDKESSRLRMQTVGREEFLKEFCPDNCVYYHVNVPELVKRVNRGRRTQMERTGKPDFEKVRDSEKSIVNRLRGNKGAGRLPILAVVDPAGNMLCAALASADEATPFASFISALKNTFEAGKYKVTVGPRVERGIDKEKRDAERKTHR